MGRGDPQPGDSRGRVMGAAQKKDLIHTSVLSPLQLEEKQMAGRCLK